MSGERDQIKIKINGKDKHYTEIDTSNTEEIAAGIAPSHNEEEEFEWILPERNNKSNYQHDMEVMDDVYIPPTQTSYYNNKKHKIGKARKRKGLPIQMQIPSGLIISILTAIIVGVGLGFAVLFVFTDEPTKNPPQSDDIPVTNISDKDKDKEVGTNKQEVADFQLDFFIVQGGVYTTNKNASTAVTEILDKGIPAVIDESDGQFYILSGIASTEQSADAIENKFKANNIKEPFAKPWAFKMENVSLPEGVKKEWMVQGEGLLKQLIATSGTVYLGSAKNEEIQKLDSDFKKWSEKEPKLGKSWSVFTDQLNLYQESLDKGIKSLSGENGIDAEQKALNAYIVFKKLILTLNK